MRHAAPLPVAITAGIAVVISIAVVVALRGAQTGAAAPTPTSAPATSTAIDQTVAEAAEATPSIGLSTSPSPYSAECQRYDSFYDGPSLTIDFATRTSERVQLVTVTGVGAARWGTEDGSPPASRGPIPRVVRLIQFRVDQDLSDAASTGASEIVWIQGGEIDCSQFVVDGYPEQIAVGDKYAVFLNSFDPITSLKGISQVEYIWTVTGSSVVTTTQGTVDISEFKSAVASAAKSLP